MADFEDQVLHKFHHMKKNLFLLILLIESTIPLALRAANTTLEDTSLVRISSAEARANFLSQIMKDRLDLDPEEYGAIQAINLKYEELLQELTLTTVPITTFGAAKKKKGDSPFDKLSEARDKEVRKALSGRHYREYDKQRWGMRNALKKQMLLEKEDRDRKVRELQLQQKKARTDSIAAAEKAIAEKKSAKEKAKGKKKSGKKTVQKKRKK
jgi:hypothetical protein